MQEIIADQLQGLPGEYQRLRSSLLTDQGGMLTATLQRLAHIARARGVEAYAIDDVVQETLLEAWSHLGRLSSPADFHAWIGGICRNVCRRYARDHQASLLRQLPFPLSSQHNVSSFEEDDTFRLANIPDSSTPDPLEVLSRQELALLLDRALGLLPRETREIVEMRYLLEMPLDEMAGHLGISAGTLYTRLHRARQHLRQALSGPLHDDAASFGLVTEQENEEGWFETRVWCSCCGHHRLQGIFIENEEGTVNLHARCPGCSRQYGMDTVHSMGLVSLGHLKSFRPAWKRTLQGLTELVLQALHERERHCPWCGHLTSIDIADAELEEANTPRLGPQRFWIRWSCVHCGALVGSPGDLPSVDQVVYWSHPQARQFMLEHPRWLSTPGVLIEHAGQPVLRFQITDAASAASLTMLAHRHTLRALAAY